MDFLSEYLKVINRSIPNNYKDNWDYNRYGPEPRESLKQKTSQFFRKQLHKRGFFNLHYFVNNLPDVFKFKYLFDNLETQEDKELLLQLIAYKWLGYRKVKLPLNTPQYWEKLDQIGKLADKADVLSLSFNNSSINKFNLTPLGYPIQLYFSPLGIMIDFIIKQYEYKKGNNLIKIEQGDTVIDAGGCWGDTALYFANEAGNSGKVYSFEFIPGNITVFEKNTSLNTALNDRIVLVNRPVWKDSSTKVYFKDRGPGSRVEMESFDGQDGECVTLSIDDLVTQKGLDRLDFIKMDIEGAETTALQGAENAIKKFKPKLAIALYHSIDDFERIPKLIKGMVPGYKFYFSHCTIFGEESMLFAKVD
jgi:FkbM family methyltransferase